MSSFPTAVPIKIEGWTILISGEILTICNPLTANDKSAKSAWLAFIEALAHDEVKLYIVHDYINEGI